MGHFNRSGPDQRVPSCADNVSCNHPTHQNLHSISFLNAPTPLVRITVFSLVITSAHTFSFVYQKLIHGLAELNIGFGQLVVRFQKAENQFDPLLLIVN